jgi:hypothetical protein
MNSPFVVSRQIARAIEFKEYLLNRDVGSRRIVLDFFIDWLLPRNDMPNVLAWFQNLRSINNDMCPADRKTAIRADAYWDDLLLNHSKESAFMEMVRQFTGKGG